MIISEFRLRGPNGSNDEYVEIYNNSDTAHVVSSVDGSTGYGLAASDGVVRFTIPNGTVIPARGHYLGVDTVGYSISSYPAGNGTTATGDATFTNSIPDNAGIALFRTSNPAYQFHLLTGSRRRFHRQANSPTRKGVYPAPTLFSIDYAFYRDIEHNCAAPGLGLLRDTDNNAADIPVR
jgi:hypothetical protein